jgi:two-component system alkaline phosphatase synthesis response regulator PhoP
VKYILTQENYSVYIAADGEQGLNLARELNPSLILLDIMLPSLDGIEVCKILRKESSVPIIMLSAKGEELDKVLGLELGADDYITKPFSKHELLARIRAVLRRFTSNTHQASKSEILQSGKLILDKKAHMVTLNGANLVMAPREFSILTLLIENPNRVLTRDEILEFIWGENWFGGVRTIDVHIRWLRQKIEKNPKNPKIITTVRGVGYRFDNEFTEFD